MELQGAAPRAYSPSKSTMKQPTDRQERNEDKKKPEKENPSHGIDPESKEPEMEVDQDRGPKKARCSLSGVEDPGERQKENQNQEKDDPPAA
jgi:hypothetical protein